MTQQPIDTGNKVVPMPYSGTGFIHVPVQQPTVTPPAAAPRISNTAMFAIPVIALLVSAAFIGGYAKGYGEPEAQKLRALQEQAQKLQEVRALVCR